MGVGFDSSDRPLVFALHIGARSAFLHRMDPEHLPGAVTTLLLTHGGFEVSLRERRSKEGT